MEGGGVAATRIARQRVVSMPRALEESGANSMKERPARPDRRKSPRAPQLDASRAFARLVPAGAVLRARDSRDLRWRLSAPGARRGGILDPSARNPTRAGRGSPGKEAAMSKKRKPSSTSSTPRSAEPATPPARIVGPRVKDVMCAAVHTCRPDDSLAAAARIMWERDCGIVPVTDEVGRLAGVVTDRDACMASYTQGKSLLTIPIASAMASRVVTVHANDDLGRAHELLRTHRIRRLPVVDGDQHVVGLLSIKDLAAHAHASADADAVTALAATVAEVTKDRAPVVM
jgi:CBS domain-containing protein